MAKKKSKAGRGPKARARDSSSDSLFRTKLEQQVETERERLARSEAVLICVIHALADSMEDEEPPHPSELRYVIEIARDLVHETINRLDSVALAYPEQRPRGR